MVHLLTNPMMIYFWMCYAVVLGMFWQRWGCACLSYLRGEQAQLAWSVNGFVVAGINTKRGGIMYNLNVKLG